MILATNHQYNASNISIDANPKTQINKSAQTHLNVVARNDIGIGSLEEGPPLEQHVLLGITGDDLSTDDGQTPPEREDVLHDGTVVVAVDADGIGNLDDGILLGLGEVTLPALTLDVQTQDAEGGDLVPLALGLVRHDLVEGHVELELAVGLLLRLALAEAVRPLGEGEPAGPGDVPIDHESEDEGDVALEGLELTAHGPDPVG